MQSLFMKYALHTHVNAFNRVLTSLLPGILFLVSKTRIYITEKTVLFLHNEVVVLFCIIFYIFVHRKCISVGNLASRISLKSLLAKFLALVVQCDGIYS